MINVTTKKTETEILTGGHVFCEAGKDGIFKDWSDLSPDVQGRLEEITAEIEALTEEGRRLLL